MNKQMKDNKISDYAKFEDGKLTGFQPTGFWFVVKAPNIQLKTIGGIIKTPQQVEKEMDQMLGEYYDVLAVGAECTKISVGSRVFLNPGKLNTFQIGDERFAMFSEHQVAAVVG